MLSGWLHRDIASHVTDNMTHTFVSLYNQIDERDMLSGGAGEIATQGYIITHHNHRTLSNMIHTFV